LLRILGTGPLEAQLQATIQSHRLQSHVRLEGFCPNPLPIYRQAQLFCLSSLFEGMPNALVEAIACGTPAVSTDCPSGPAEILAAGKLGALVPPGDPNALAMAMDDAIGNYASWKERTAAAEQHIRIMFGADVGMQRLTGELQQVLATEMSNAQQST